MRDVADVESARADWLDAAVTYAQAAARLHRLLQGGQRPTPEEFARSENAKAALEAARARYVRLIEELQAKKETPPKSDVERRGRRSDQSAS